MRILLKYWRRCWPLVLKLLRVRKALKLVATFMSKAARELQKSSDAPEDALPLPGSLCKRWTRMRVWLLENWDCELDQELHRVCARPEPTPIHKLFLDPPTWDDLRRGCDMELLLRECQVFCDGMHRLIGEYKRQTLECVAKPASEPHGGSPGS